MTSVAETRTMILAALEDIPGLASQLGVEASAVTQRVFVNICATPGRFERQQGWQSPSCPDLASRRPA